MKDSYSCVYFLLMQELFTHFCSVQFELRCKIGSKGNVDILRHSICQNWRQGCVILVTYTWLYSVIFLVIFGYFFNFILFASSLVEILWPSWIWFIQLLRLSLKFYLYMHDRIILLYERENHEKNYFVYFVLIPYFQWGILAYVNAVALI